jgi:hypothetical protein
MGENCVFLTPLLSAEFQGPKTWFLATTAELDLLRPNESLRALVSPPRLGCLIPVAALADPSGFEEINVFGEGMDISFRIL